jgi:hypothetical protein
MSDVNHITSHAAAVHACVHTNQAIASSDRQHLQTRTYVSAYTCAGHVVQLALASLQQTKQANSTQPVLSSDLAMHHIGRRKTRRQAMHYADARLLLSFCFLQQKQVCANTQADVVA